MVARKEKPVCRAAVCVIPPDDHPLGINPIPGLERLRALYGDA
jgi:hypothetical protein